MKASELMIGDWVKQKHSGLLLMVCAVNPPYINAESEDGQFLEDTIEPIPLTEEMLKANGFEEHVGEKGAYGVTTAPYFKRDDSPEVFCDGDPFAVWFDEPVDIKYVHQLQHVLRLYGAEKEIKIKED
jgi:hypothetical protein